MGNLANSNQVQGQSARDCLKIGLMDRIGKALGPTVRRLRQEALLSVEVVAHAAGISQARLKLIESGGAGDIRMREAVLLAAALGTDLPDLVGKAGLGR